MQYIRLLGEIQFKRCIWCKEKKYIDKKEGVCSECVQKKKVCNICGAFIKDSREG